MSRRQLAQYCGDLSEEEGDGQISSKISSQEGAGIKVPVTDNKGETVEPRTVEEQSPEPPTQNKEKLPEKSES